MVNQDMVIFRQFCKMLALMFLGSAAWASAATPLESLHFIGRYDFGWSGIPLAAVELSIDEDKENYSLHVVIVSKGIVNLFTRHRSDTTVSGKRKGNEYRPRLYESRYWTKNKPRHIRFAYDAAGKMTQEIVEPPEDRNERPEVPHTLKDGSIDPLSLILAVPNGLEQPHAFDGKHLYEGHAVKGEQTGLRLYDGIHAAIGYSLTRTPLAGMTDREIAQYRQGEPALAFYFSADDRHIPLYMSLPLYLSSLRGSLTKECKTWDECKVN